jgi:transcriptional regulator with GAF, ATPase, and Fis domain
VLTAFRSWPAFIDRFCRDLNKKAMTLASSAEDALRAPWPGNVRELQNCIEQP